MSAVAVVNAPPKPMPVMNRHSANVATLVAVAASSVAIPNSAVLKSKVRRKSRRPIRRRARTVTSETSHTLPRHLRARSAYQ